jgi:hypothetical protein
MDNLQFTIDMHTTSVSLHDFENHNRIIKEGRAVEPIMNMDHHNSLMIISLHFSFTKNLFLCRLILI